jgi:hypothetical protein
MHSLIQRKEPRKREENEPEAVENTLDPVILLKKDTEDGILPQVVGVPLCLISAALGTWFYLKGLEVNYSIIIALNTRAVTTNGCSNTLENLQSIFYCQRCFTSALFIRYY